MSPHTHSGPSTEPAHGSPPPRSAGPADRLVYRPEDFGAAVHFTSRGISAKAVSGVASLLAQGEQVAATRQVTAALVRLVDLGAARWDEDGEVRWTGALTLEAALEASKAETERENEVERSRLEMMRRYAEHTGCRRSFLLSYFGQSYPGPCGHCDNDLTLVPHAPAIEPFAVGG